MRGRVDVEKRNEIVRLHQSGLSFREIGERMGLAPGTIKTHYYLSTGQLSGKIPESPYAIYDKPPVLEGDALVLPDCEIPFHHAEFINRCLDIADTWHVNQMVAAGDLLHFDSLSSWNPSWTNPPSYGLSEENSSRLLDIARTLPKKYQSELIDVVAEMGSYEANVGFSEEMEHCRSTLKAFNDLFDIKVWTLGNHCGRILRAINSPAQPSEILNLMHLDDSKWKIAPYYYCLLNTSCGTFRITHPKGTANNTARSLASQYLQHILMGHSHKMFYDWDVSGNYYAIQMGHAVDENRLAYVAQRDAKRDSHKLGAVIVRDGYPYLLHENVRWDHLKRMA